MHVRITFVTLVIVFGGALIAEALHARAAPPPAAAPAGEAGRKLVIVQVREEVCTPGRRTSKRIDDHAAVVRDGWYHAADDSFRLRIPALESGRVNVVRRRWETPDGVDVKFTDDDAPRSVAVFSFEPGLEPAAEALAKKYSKYLSAKGARFETNVIETDFGRAVETVAMEWVQTADYPYQPPAIDASAEKRSMAGATVGVNWTFWKDGTQCGLSMILPADGAADDAAAFARARSAVRDFANGLAFKKGDPPASRGHAARHPGKS